MSRFVSRQDGSTAVTAPPPPSAGAPKVTKITKIQLELIKKPQKPQLLPVLCHDRAKTTTAEGPQLDLPHLPTELEGFLSSRFGMGSAGTPGETQEPLGMQQLLLGNVELFIFPFQMCWLWHSQPRAHWMMVVVVLLLLLDTQGSTWEQEEGEESGQVIPDPPGPWPGAAAVLTSV